MFLYSTNKAEMRQLVPYRKKWDRYKDTFNILEEDNLNLNEFYEYVTFKRYLRGAGIMRSPIDGCRIFACSDLIAGDHVLLYVLGMVTEAEANQPESK